MNKCAFASNVSRNSFLNMDHGGGGGIGDAVSERSADVRNEGRRSSSHKKFLAYFGKMSLLLGLAFILSASETTGVALNVASFTAVVTDMAVFAVALVLKAGAIVELPTRLA